METHAVIEIEEGALNVVVGSRDGQHTTVSRTLSLPLQAMTRDAFEKALRAVRSEVQIGTDGVHVVIGDRRAVHFLSTVPRMSPRDAVGFVGREAARVANVSEPGELLLSTRLVRRLSGGRFMLATTALPRAVWNPIGAALEACGLRVLGVHTIEACLAGAVAGSAGQATAVLECHGNRARFAFCVDGVPVQVRRFVVGAGADQNPGMLMAQLAMEMPRTFDWLRESGQQLPERLLVGLRVGIDDESLDMLAGEDATTVVRAECPVGVGENQMTPNLGVAWLLNAISAGEVAGSLLKEPRLQFPMGAGSVLSIAASWVLAAGAGYYGYGEAMKWRELTGQAQTVQSELDAVTAALNEHLDVDEEDEAANPRLTSALQMRRPISRLVAEVSNAASQLVHLEELKFASKSPVVISGQVYGEDREGVLAAMASFSQHLQQLPYLKNTQEEIKEVPGAANRLQFVLSLSWRTR